MNTCSTCIPHGIIRAAVVVILSLGSGAVYATGDGGENPPPPSPSHFKCYQLAEKGGALNDTVTLHDQFHTEKDVKVKNPHLLCAPVIKEEHCKGDYKDACTTTADGSNVDELLNGPHLLCWKIAPSGPALGADVTTQGSQFEDRTVKVQTGQFLCEFVTKILNKK